MNLFRLIRRIPFTLNTVDYDRRWHPDQLHKTSLPDEDASYQFPVKSKPFYRGKSVVLKSVIQNLSIIKSCLFYYPNIIPDPEKKVAYLRIPKAGSSSIIYLLLHGDIDSRKIDNREEEIERAAFYFRTTKLSPLPSDTEYFSVVRNPFARLVSAYLDTYKTSDSFKSNYDCYFFGLFRQEYSFTEFVDCISLIPRQLLIDQLKPQQMIIKSFQVKKIRLFKLETNTQQIKEFLGKSSVSLPKLNVTRKDDYRMYYTPELLEKVYKIYKEDIESFDYVDEYQKIKDYLWVS